MFLVEFTMLEDVLHMDAADHVPCFSQAILKSDLFQLYADACQ
jgi:hypothetical protein